MTTGPVSAWFVVGAICAIYVVLVVLYLVAVSFRPRCPDCHYPLHRCGCGVIGGKPDCEHLWSRDRWTQDGWHRKCRLCGADSYCDLIEKGPRRAIHRTDIE